MAVCEICGQDVAHTQITGGICDECLKVPASTKPEPHKFSIAGPPSIARRPSPPKKQPTAPTVEGVDLIDGEEAILREPAAIVTRSRCIMPARTVFLSTVSGVETRSIAPDKTGYLMLCVLGTCAGAGGILIVLAGLATGTWTLAVMGAIMALVLGLGFGWASGVVKSKLVTLWTVCVMTQTGPVELLRTADRMLCERIAHAIDKAKTAR